MPLRQRRSCRCLAKRLRMPRCCRPPPASGACRPLQSSRRACHSRVPHDPEVVTLLGTFRVPGRHDLAVRLNHDFSDPVLTSQVGVNPAGRSEARVETAVGSVANDEEVRVTWSPDHGSGDDDFPVRLDCSRARPLVGPEIGDDLAPGTEGRIEITVGTCRQRRKNECRCKNRECPDPKPPQTASSVPRFCHRESLR